MGVISGEEWGIAIIPIQRSIILWVPNNQIAKEVGVVIPEKKHAYFL